MIVWLKPNNADNSNQETVSSEISKPSKQQPSTDDLEKLAVIEKAFNSKVNQQALKNLPKSLQGTTVDGEIIIDENKQLVVTHGLRRLFDYFLSAQGEEADELIHARVKSYIEKHTPEPAATQAVQIYKQYVLYLQAVAELEKNFGDLQMRDTKAGKLDLNLIKQRRSDVNGLQQKYFDQKTIDAFFTKENRLEQYTLAMMALDKDKNLTLEQKRQAKQSYINQMPEGVDKAAFQEHQQQQSVIMTLSERTEALKKQGASDQEIYEMRKNLVGEGAAQRLAKVDNEEQSYQDKYMAYKQQKESIIQQYGQEGEESNRQLEALQEKIFTPEEVKRLAGYEAVEQTKN